MNQQPDQQQPTPSENQENLSQQSGTAADVGDGGTTLVAQQGSIKNNDHDLGPETRSVANGLGTPQQRQG